MPRRFGALSTGEEVLQGVDLAGKVAIVTGGTAGLGEETARCLAAAGADVVITARSAEAGKRVAASIAASGVKGSVRVQQMDLADLASVRAAAAALQQLPRIDLLILNAGIMACPLAYTKDGFEMQIGTNHFGHFVLATSLLNKMTAQDFPSRVVCLASSGHAFQRGPMNFDDLHYKKGRKYGAWTVYGQSKAANILFVKELNKRLAGTKVEAYALHPGGIQTNLQRHLTGIIGLLLGALLGLLTRLPFVAGVKSIPQGVSTTLYAATAPELEGKGGSYLVDCAIAEPNKTCRDMEQAARLWEVTEAQVAAAQSPEGFRP